MLKFGIYLNCRPELGGIAGQVWRWPLSLRELALGPRCGTPKAAKFKDKKGYARGEMPAKAKKTRKNKTKWLPGPDSNQRPTG
jgi:hypothetical protein